MGYNTGTDQYEGLVSLMYGDSKHSEQTSDGIIMSFARPAKRVNVCVTVFNRYDLLAGFLMSVQQSTIYPDCIYIIDNGRNPKLLDAAIKDVEEVFVVPIERLITPGQKQLSVAQMFNWFIQAVPEERIICNDDVLFSPDTIEKILKTPGPFVSPIVGTNACSCFAIRDSCVDQVGLFDESISPGYAYFEDCDYGERMAEAKVDMLPVDTVVAHLGSKTNEAKTEEQMQDHHRRFLIAQENFLRKWGYMPGGRVRQGPL